MTPKDIGRIIIETGITVLDQRHKSQEQVSLNGKAAAEFIKMLNIDTLAFDKWLTQDVPLSKNSSIEFSDDYVQLSEKLGKIVEEQNEKLIHGKKK